MQLLLAKKLGMTQRYQADAAVPTTVLAVQPCIVTQIKTVERDGYVAIQVATGERRGIGRALRGHFAVSAGTENKKNQQQYRFVREVRVQDASDFTIGDVLDVSLVRPGDRVNIVATAKGKGFAGVVKRYNFHGQDATHGTKDQLRMPGSIGSTGPQHVFKGTRMAGRMGGNRVTVKNLTVVAVDPEKQTIEVKGAVPGARGALVEMRPYTGYWS